MKSRDDCALGCFTNLCTVTKTPNVLGMSIKTIELLHRCSSPSVRIMFPMGSYHVGKEIGGQCVIK
jgi:hypothetical protein